MNQSRLGAYIRRRSSWTLPNLNKAAGPSVEKVGSIVQTMQKEKHERDFLMRGRKPVFHTRKSVPGYRGSSAALGAMSEEARLQRFRDMPQRLGWSKSRPPFAF